MTSIIAIVEDRQAHLVTDGAVTFRKRIVGLQTKVLPVPHLGVAVACRGRQWLANRLLIATSMHSSLTDLRQNFAVGLKRQFGWKAKILPWLYHFDIVVAGVENGNGFAFLISSAKRPGMATFAPIEIELALDSPQVEGFAQLVEEATAGSAAGDTRALDAAARKMVAAQLSSGVVGGFVQVTSIGSRGIMTRIIQRFEQSET